MEKTSDKEELKQIAATDCREGTVRTPTRDVANARAARRQGGDNSNTGPGWTGYGD